MNMILRDYQARAVAEVRAAWQAVPRVLLALPTGGGKTECAIALAGDEIAAERRVLVVVERKVLCVQWRERFARHGFEHVGVLQGENTVMTWAPILVATAQTLRARGIPDNVGLIVLDESHIWHQTHDRVLEACGDAKVLGLSATPLREGLGARFDKLVIGATIKELTAAGHLVPARVFAPSRVQITQALEQINIRAGDYAADQLSTLMRQKAVIGDVITNWRDRADNRPTIAFCVDKAHARELADEFVLAGVPAAVVVDETSDEERAEAFAQFDRGEIKVLSSVGVLGVGFDSPIASCAILARPTLSTMLHIQQSGRVIRPSEGKVDAVILDHAANSLRHGLPIDFVPPTELSEIDRASDKKRKDAERSELTTCRNCECIYDRSEDACPECGTPRTVHTKVDRVGGEAGGRHLEQQRGRAGRGYPGGRTGLLPADAVGLRDEGVEVRRRVVQDLRAIPARCRLPQPDHERAAPADLALRRRPDRADAGNPALDREPAPAPVHQGQDMPSEQQHERCHGICHGSNDCDAMAMPVTVTATVLTVLTGEGGSGAAFRRFRKLFPASLRSAC